MNAELVNIPLLKRKLWIDFIIGYCTAMAGLIFYPALPRLLGLPPGLILVIAGITFLYAIIAFILARKKEPAVSQVQVFTYSKWVWAFMSLILLYSYFSVATLSGIVFLVAQLLVVIVLGNLEARHLQ